MICHILKVIVDLHNPGENTFKPEINKFKGE